MKFVCLFVFLLFCFVYWLLNIEATGNVFIRNGSAVTTFLPATLRYKLYNVFFQE